jgi:uroporphyrin-III C-methyltransferase
MKQKPHITLIGAGPGDPELITLKGLKALETADVILYDALVNEDLLDLAPHSKKIFVGKRKGFRLHTQDEINNMLVRESLKNGHVVRLKGGDPFVFGRGYEEVQYAQLFGIPVEVIPGISSAIAVPALAGIPVTHRGAANGFFVLTAVLADGSFNPEVALALQTKATVVILMGLGQLSRIAGLLIGAGKASEAVAVISNGSLPGQESVFGNAETIVDQVIREQVAAPAVIVIGDVVRLATPKNIVGLGSNFFPN